MCANFRTDCGSLFLKYKILIEYTMRREIPIATRLHSSTLISHFIRLFNYCFINYNEVFGSKTGTHVGGTDLYIGIYIKIVLYVACIWIKLITF